MKQLEAVYLANVVLYVNAIETIIKLIQVNKKCQEATKIIRYYEIRKLYENADSPLDRVVVPNLFDLFPNIETIHYRYDNLANNFELNARVNQIEMAFFYFGHLDLSNEIEEKIIQLSLVCVSPDNIQLTQFPNVRKVRIVCEMCDLNVFLGDNNIKLNQLLIETEDNDDLNCLEKYRNIEKIIIKMKNEITKERYNELKLFAEVYCQYPVIGIDIKYTLCLNDDNQLLILKESNINRLYNLTLFTSCLVNTHCDLRNCEFLETIDISLSNKKNLYIRINGLKHLNTIKNIVRADCIPSSVTNLSFTPKFRYKELLEKDNNCFKNIKEICFRIGCNETIEHSKILLNFMNCTKIELIDRNELTPSELPLSVQELRIANYAHKKQMNEITKLTGLKKLEISFTTKENKQIVNEFYENLKELEHLVTNYVDEIALPSTVTFLELRIRNNTDLHQNTNLKKIDIFCFESNNKEIKLPNTLNEVCISGNVIVTNSNEIDVKTLILQNTPSQLCEWKSKKIVIEEFKKY